MNTDSSSSRNIRLALDSRDCPYCASEGRGLFPAQGDPFGRLDRPIIDRAVDPAWRLRRLHADYLDGLLDIREGNSATWRLRERILALVNPYENCTDRTLVYAALRESPGSTAAELADLICLEPIDVRRRLDDLRLAGNAWHGEARRMCSIARNHQFPWYPTDPDPDEAPRT